MTDSTVNKDEIDLSIEKISKVRQELAKKITGQERVLHNLVLCMVAQGHALLEGMPGLAKTLIAKTLAAAVSVPFSRVQFTPDLLPGDIIGTVVFNPKVSGFETRKGPIFTGIFLADEINRSPSKVQSALLQAMEERIVTIGDTTFTLDSPFMVMATENPIDQEGTYQLPEAQMDRFLMKIMIDYPEKEHEVMVLTQHGSTQSEKINAVISGEELQSISALAEKVHVEDRLKEYIVNLVRYTRPAGQATEVSGYISYGASPRASLALLKASRVNAMLDGRSFVVPEDIHGILSEVLRHRIVLSFEAMSEDVQISSVIDTIRESVEVP